MQNKNLPSTKIIEDALLKKALGYEAKEVVEEFVADEKGNFKMCKKKVTKKHISPDISAAKVLLEHYENVDMGKYDNMTEEELMRVKLELIKLLKEGENDAN